MTLRVSVVIPTHNRRNSVERTLAALGGQTVSPTAFEVIVIADGCTDDTEAALTRAQWPFEFTIRTLPAGGPARARNAGAEAARGNLLLFLDDDIDASPGLIAAHLNAAERSPRQAAVGYLPPRLESQGGFFRSALRKWWETMFETMRDPGHRFGYTDFLTGNVSLPRGLFTELGGFDEEFQVHEDYEFGYRLLAAGAELVFLPDAWGHHDERTDVRRALGRKRHEGRADLLLRAKHPDLAPRLPFARMSRGLSRRQWLGVRIALEWPWLGDRWATVRRFRLRFDEFFSQRVAWEGRLDRLLAYWYWRGFGEAGGSVRDLITDDDTTASGAGAAPLLLDLALGAAKAAAVVDAARPAALDLRLGAWPIGTIPAVPGAERLRGCHLQAALGRDLAWRYLAALALTEVAPHRPPVVSVVVPFKNSADTIAETLDSLVAQSFRDWEAILVDDGATDATPEIVGRLARVEPRVRVIRSRDAGKSAARNAGIGVAQGEWLLFLDSDDWLLPDALNRMVAAGTEDTDGVVCGWSSTLPDGRVLLTESPPSGPDLFAVAALRCPFPIHACLVRRNTITRIGCFDAALDTCEDWDLWQRLARTGARFTPVEAELVRYRLRPGSESSDVRRLVDDALRVIDRGHGHDDRVEHPAAAHAGGSPVHERSAAGLGYLGWAGGVLIGQGQTGLDLLKLLGSGPTVLADGTALGEGLFPAILRGGLRDRDQWFDLCADAHERVAVFAEAIAGHLGLPGMDRQILLGFEAAVISRAPFEGRRTIGRTAGIHLDLEASGEDVDLPVSIERIVILPQYAGRAERVVTLPVCDGFVPAEVIRDAVAAAVAWPLLRSFFEANLRPLLTIERGAEGLYRITRGNCLLAADWAGDPDQLDDLHDAVGWTLVLQEVLGDPSMTAERLYHGSDLAAEWQATEEPLPTRVVVELGESMTLPPAAQTIPYEVEIRLGGAPVGVMRHDHRPGDRVERLAAAIFNHLGYESAIGVAREAIIGQPVVGGGSIRERLAVSARTPRAPDRPGTLRIGRRAMGGPVGAAARHAALPAAAAAQLREAATARGEPVATPSDHVATRAVRYHPDWLWQADAELAVGAVEPPEPRVVEDRHFFESLFAKEPDPWRYGGAYEQLKYRQTLSLVPETGIDRALELGSAEGFFTGMLAPRVGHLVAGDISAVALERARVRCSGHGNVDYLRLDFGTDPIPGGQDLIVCSESLYYLSGIDELRAVATRMAAALVPGGWLVLAHANVVADDPTSPGFDWGTRYGARRIGETFGEVESLRWHRELQCPYYRIQLFEKAGRPAGAVQQPEHVVSVEYAVPEPGVAAHFSRGDRPATVTLTAPVTTTRSIPVLMYHRVASDIPPNQRRFAIDPASFRRQMGYLAEAGFRTLTVEEWRIAVERRRPVPTRSVLLTFDDGYRDFAEEAWPVCRELGLVPNVFLVAGAIGGSNNWDAGWFDSVPLLDWPEIRRLHRQGVHFGSHSVGHRSLQRLCPMDATFELLESKRLLEQGLESTVTSIAYPFGEADPAVQHLAGGVGYLLGLTVTAKASSVLDNPLSIPRIEIRGDESFDQFLVKLS